MKAFPGCNAACATPVPCPSCGQNMPPRGASIPLAMDVPQCCRRHAATPLNTRHIWTPEDLE